MNFRSMIMLCLALFFSNLTRATQSPLLFGMNMCGAEFGENNLPGVYNVHYTYPSDKQIDYFYNKGMRLIDLPFKWERIQKNLGGALDQFELKMIQDVVRYCEAKGIKVILSVHNFGRYNINGVDHIIGSPTVTRDHFNNLWSQLARYFKSYTNIYAYDLTSEPHHMGSYSWFETAQQAINTIRNIDNKTAIMVAGDNYAACEKWVQYSDNLKNLYDPIDNIIYDAHSYFDYDYSGRYRKSYDENGVDEWIGVKRTKPFIEWLKRNNKKGFIGEFGVPYNDSRWLKALENFTNYLNANGIQGNYWAGGPLWDDSYTLSAQPNKNGEERPQIFILQRYTTASISNKPAVVAKESEKSNFLSPGIIEYAEADVKTKQSKVNRATVEGHKKDISATGYVLLPKGKNTENQQHTVAAPNEAIAKSSDAPKKKKIADPTPSGSYILSGALLPGANQTKNSSGVYTNNRSAEIRPVSR